ncbi:MAG TPA: hypothetical protein VLH39_04400, partial [Magnetospirillaceae bacterium]|nr:hypothetical protein [Magnetospirillaceae bacterium]
MGTDREELNTRRNLELLLASLDRRGLLAAAPDLLTEFRDCSFGRVDLGGGAFWYPRSLFLEGGILFLVAGTGAGQESDAPTGWRDDKRLLVITRDRMPPGFEGSRRSVSGFQVLDGPRSWANYLAAREYLPFLAPVSLRRRRTT